MQSGRYDIWPSLEKTSNKELLRQNNELTTVTLIIPEKTTITETTIERFQFADCTPPGIMPCDEYISTTVTNFIRSTV